MELVERIELELAELDVSDNAVFNSVETTPGVGVVVWVGVSVGSGACPGSRPVRSSAASSDFISLIVFPPEHKTILGLS